LAQNKHLWRRLQSLEEEYDALTRSDTFAGSVSFPYRPFITHLTDDWREPDRLRVIRREITALRMRFGIAQEPETPEAPSRPRVILHRLPRGKMHPVSPQEIHQTLAELPSVHQEDLRAVILTDRRRDRHASYGRRRIKLFYPVDDRCRVRLRRNEGWGEVSRFGAWVEEEDGVRYVCWHPQDLKNYVLRHLLLHEIGHHVAWLRGCSTVATRREEEFAESYAYAYFDPARG
jgi:hypothetical protein